MQVYVIFENKSTLPFNDTSRLLTRKETPLAVVILKPAMNKALFSGKDFDFAATQLYKNKEHELVMNDIKGISETQRKALNLTDLLIDYKLVNAFGRAAILGANLQGQIVYVTMEHDEKGPGHSTPLPLQVFLDRQDGDNKSIPVQVYGHVNDFLMHQRDIQFVSIFATINNSSSHQCKAQPQAQPQPEPQKISLRPETRRVLGLDN